MQVRNLTPHIVNLAGTVRPPVPGPAGRGGRDGDGRATRRHGENAFQGRARDGQAGQVKGLGQGVGWVRRSGGPGPRAR